MAMDGALPPTPPLFALHVGSRMEYAAGHGKSRPWREEADLRVVERGLLLGFDLLLRRRVAHTHRDRTSNSYSVRALLTFDARHAYSVCISQTIAHVRRFSLILSLHLALTLVTRTQFVSLILSSPARSSHHACFGSHLADVPDGGLAPAVVRAAELGVREFHRRFAHAARARDLHRDLLAAGTLISRGVIDSNSSGNSSTARMRFEYSL